MSGCGRIDNLGPPEFPLLSIYRVHPFCLCDSVTCLTSSIKNFPSLTTLGWVPKILSRWGNSLPPGFPRRNRFGSVSFTILGNVR